MKKYLAKILLLIPFVLAFGTELYAQQSAVYVGGHIRRERPGTITKLRNSGFTTAILFNVHVDTDGTLMTDGETICKNGVYVFGNTQPNYVSDVKALKTYPTGINRIEICIGGWGNDSFDHIKELINASGTGSGTMLYKNFRALKQAIPEIDAVNNDQEQCYDAATTIQFHVMMRDLGYKTTLAPYTGNEWWKYVANQINAQRPGTVDRMMVQCYDGGAGNNPSDYAIGGMELWAGRMNYQSSAADALTQFQNWKKNNGVVGGFIWVYNDETWNLNQWASAINRTYSPKTTDTPAATFYQNSDYGGYAISLPEGSFPMCEMALYGLKAADVSSLKVQPGYKVTLFTNADFTGSKKTFTANSNYVGDDWNDKAKSIRIEPNGVSGIEGIYKLKNRASGLYMDCDGNKTANDTKVVQWTDEGDEQYQWWQLEETSDKGVYHLRPASNTATKCEVYYGYKDNGTGLVIYNQTEEYNNSQFILYDAGSGYYKLIARHACKPLIIASGTTEPGTQVTLYTNSSNNCQQWQLERKQAGDCNVATFYKNADYGGYAISLEEGTYTTWQLRMYGISDNDISSLKVKSGFKVTVYDAANNSGTSTAYTANTASLGSWNDKISSLTIAPAGATGKAGVYRLKGYNSGLYWGINNNSTASGQNLQQQSSSTHWAQEFRLTETATAGVYTISNRNSALVLDVWNNSCANRAEIKQGTANGGTNQQFVLVDKGDGWYQVVARNNGKVIEVPDNTKNNGDVLKLWDNNEQKCSWWKLEKVTNSFTGDLTDNGGIIRVSHTAVNSSESEAKLIDNTDGSKYCAAIGSNDEVWIRYSSTQKAVLTAYTLCSANDAHGRDPKAWRLEGSNDGTNWTVLDTRSNQTFVDFKQKHYYEVSTTEAFGMFRLVVTARNDAASTIFQMAEWQLFGNVTGSFDPMTQVAENAASDIRVWPLPMTDRLHIDGADGLDIRLVDTLGRTLLQTTATDHTTLDVSDLHSGYYLLRVGDKVFKILR
ncbi:MAG: RICIN domain-containing protein [Paludibacteraceae bacterium]|nr:RICIN domain-containing protein [Paludibacteraceae bacterium]